MKVGSGRFTDKQPFVVTEDDLNRRWGSGFTPEARRRAFSCGFCFHRFEPGDIARWVYVEGAPNTWVCREHDYEDVAERFAERWKNEILPILQRWCGDYE